MTGSGARLTFLGTGTSQGVPIIGCKCDVCRSADPRDKRFRASVFVEYGGLNILVDAGATCCNVLGDIASAVAMKRTCRLPEHEA